MSELDSKCEVVPYIPRTELGKKELKRPFWPHDVITASTEPEKKQEAELHELICRKMNEIVVSYKWSGETTTIKLRGIIPKNGVALRKRKKNNPVELVKRERAKRNTSTVIVSVSNASIDLPSDFPDVDIDKLPVPKWKNDINGGNYKRRYTFAERLKGWSGKRTQRPGNCRSDPTYKHKQSGVLIRSYVSMVKFLIYEEIQGYKRKPLAGGKTKAKSEGKASWPKKTNKNDNTADESEPQLVEVEVEENPESKKRKRTPRNKNDKDNNATEEPEQKSAETGKGKGKRISKEKDNKYVSNGSLVQVLVMTAKESENVLATASNSVPKGNEESKSISEQIFHTRRVNNISADDDGCTDDAISDPARAQVCVKVDDVDEVTVAGIEPQAIGKENEVEAKLNNGCDNEAMVIIEDSEYQMDAIFNSLPDLFPIDFLGH